MKETSAPAPLPDDYFLNVNTLSGETFTIKMVGGGEGDEYIQDLCIKARIASHYKRKLLDKIIEESNVIIPKHRSKYGRINGGYLCGATEEVIDEIKRYTPERQKLIYNNEILEQEHIINGTVNLNNNDLITVVFTV